jgi:two-component system response regulator VicR
MSQKILVVDDEKNIVDILAFNLRKEGYEVITAADGKQGLEAAFSQDPDLILLDVMMPEISGFDVCKKIREKMSTPIIMLTARAEELDKVLGLELGADDYVTKPFGVRELIARVKANLRRKPKESTTGEQLAATVEEKTNSIVFKDIVIDMDRYEVIKRGVPLELTLREFELVKFLASQRSQIFSRENLLEKVWGYEYYGDLRTVDVTIRRLREKLEDNASTPEYILTKRGVGYYFNRG